MMIRYGLCGLQSEEKRPSAVVEDCVYNNKAKELSVMSVKTDSKPDRITMESGSKMPGRALQLSNKERLLLRKQALKMKKRPVLAVGNITPIYESQIFLFVANVVSHYYYCFSNFIWGLIHVQNFFFIFKIISISHTLLKFYIFGLFIYLMHFLIIDLITNDLSIWGTLCCYIGRSNIVTGVAKTILAHFKKHPLAIVNVKGRAKGTSVQEVVFQLEVCKPEIFIFIFFTVRLKRLAESFPPALSLSKQRVLF